MVDHALRKMSMAVDAVLLRFSAYSLIYGALCTLTVAGEFCWFFPVVTSLFFPPSFSTSLYILSKAVKVVLFISPEWQPVSGTPLPFQVLYVHFL